MSFTIKAGPSRHLCETCAHSVVATGHHGQLVLSVCNEGGVDRAVLAPVAACNGYDFRWGSDWEHRDKAWILELSKTREFVGFRPPKRKEE